jgi:hypothetical protein
MGIGTSIFLIAVGAILAFAVHVTNNTSGVDLHTVGWILMIVGAIGALLSLAFWSRWGGVGTYGRRRTMVDRPAGTVVEERHDLY